MYHVMYGAVKNFVKGDVRGIRTASLHGTKE